MHYRCRTLRSLVLINNVQLKGCSVGLSANTQLSSAARSCSWFSVQINSQHDEVLACLTEQEIQRSLAIKIFRLRPLGIPAVPVARVGKAHVALIQAGTCTRVPDASAWAPAAGISVPAQLWPVAGQFYSPHSTCPHASHRLLKCWNGLPAAEFEEMNWIMPETKTSQTRLQSSSWAFFLFAPLVCRAQTRRGHRAPMRYLSASPWRTQQVACRTQIRMLKYAQRMAVMTWLRKSIPDTGLFGQPSGLLPDHLKETLDCQAGSSLRMCAQRTQDAQHNMVPKQVH